MMPTKNKDGAAAVRDARGVHTREQIRQAQRADSADEHTHSAKGKQYPTRNIESDSHHRPASSPASRRTVRVRKNSSTAKTPIKLIKA